MSRYRRRWGRPTSTRRGARPVRMILLLVVLAFIYSQARKASTWRWLAPQQEAAEAAAPAVQPPPFAETVHPGPTDVEERDLKENRDKLSVLVDQTPRSLQDMPAYWLLLRWALAQSFDELQARAQTTTMSTLWDQPNEFRGKLVSLNVHVRRIEEYPAPQNSAGVSKVYEVWGWTEDSKSLPYSFVVPEIPPGMAVGSEVAYDAAFVGYFLKWLRYTPGVGPERSSPLLLGRIRQLSRLPESQAAKPPSDPLGQWAVGIVITIMLGLMAWVSYSGRRKTALAPGVDQEAATLEFLQHALSGTPGDPDHSGAENDSPFRPSSSTDPHESR